MTDPLKRYTKMHIPDGRGSKIFMNPNYALTLYNHFANMEPTAIVTYVGTCSVQLATLSTTREVEGHCAYMAHLVHLFWYRPHVVNKKDFNVATTWWYVKDPTELIIS